MLFMSKNKGVLIAILFLIATVGYFGFRYITQPTVVDTTKTNNPIQVALKNQLSVDDAIAKLKTKGFILGDKQADVYYQLIGAYDGAKIDVDGTNVELYQYTSEQKDAKIKASQSLMSADSNVFESGSLLILVHSKDKDFAVRIKQALK